MGKNEIYQALYEFIVVMKEKLDENIEKGKTGWRDMTADWLYMRLQGEMGELFAELMSANPDPDKVARECADVANFAMMIADRVRNDTRGNESGDPQTEAPPKA